MLSVFFISLLGLIAFSVPIAFSLMLTAIVLMLVSGDGFMLTELARNTIKGIENFALLAIPFFMLAGELMNKGGISVRIVALAQALVGSIKGGLGYVGVLSSMVFAGISGSAIADTTAIGSILLPMMKQSNYNVNKSTSLICAAGCIGPIIPPSIPMIVYGVTAEVSIVKLFLGGIIPGILIGVALMILWFFDAKRYDYPALSRPPVKEVLLRLKDAFLALILPVIILGGIILGIATPTESAVIAVVYAFVVSFFIYKELRLRDMPEIFYATAKGTAIVMFVLGSANAVGYMITSARVPETVINSLLAISNSPYMILFLINIVLLIVGCVLDVAPAILIMVPLLLPVIPKFGFNPIHFGVMVCVNLCIGMLTPPVGNVLYVGCSLSRIPVMELVKAIYPHILAMIGVLLLITYFPIFVTFIPSLLH